MRTSMHLVVQLCLVIAVTSSAIGQSTQPHHTGQLPYDHRVIKHEDGSWHIEYLYRPTSQPSVGYSNSPPATSQPSDGDADGRSTDGKRRGPGKKPADKPQDCAKAYVRSNFDKVAELAREELGRYPTQGSLTASEAAVDNLKFLDEERWAAATKLSNLAHKDAFTDEKGNIFIRESTWNASDSRADKNRLISHEQLHSVMRNSGIKLNEPHPSNDLWIAAEEAMIDKYLKEHPVKCGEGN